MRYLLIFLCLLTGCESKRRPTNEDYRKIFRNDKPIGRDLVVHICKDGRAAGVERDLSDPTKKTTPCKACGKPLVMQPACEAEEPEELPYVVVVDKCVESSCYRFGIRNGALVIEQVPEKYFITIQPCIDGEPDGPKERIEVSAPAYARIKRGMQCYKDFLERELKADDPFRFG
jgi:hypothetical protein